MLRLPANLPPDIIVFDGECVLCSGFYRFMLPKSDTWETADKAGDFQFSVTATAFLAGRLIHYQGALKPQ